MFEIHVADTDANSGTIPISWCVDKELLAELEAKGVRDPQVVICVAPQKGYDLSKESRKVVPLKDLMAYVEFRVPGKNKIYGFISFKGKRNAQNSYLLKESRRFGTNILNYKGDDWKAGWEDVEHKDVVSVDVPAGCFAAEPPDWEKAWVNHLFHYKPDDQCHYRRRRLFAYTVQPFIMIINIVLRWLMLTAALLIGSRNLREEWKTAFKPLTYSLEDAWEMLGGGTVFIKPYKEREPETFMGVLWWCIKRGWTLIFMPLLLIPLLVAFVLVGVVSTLKYVAMGLAAFLGLFAFMVILGAMLDGETRDRIFAWFFEDDGLWYTDEDEVVQLLCDGTDKPMKVSKLPKKHRTIKLRFSELKSKVCRPFAG